MVGACSSVVVTDAVIKFFFILNGTKRTLSSVLTLQKDCVVIVVRDKAENHDILAFHMRWQFYLVILSSSRRC